MTSRRARRRFPICFPRSIAYCVHQLARADVIHSFFGCPAACSTTIAEKSLGGDPRLCFRTPVMSTGALPILSVFGGKITTFPQKLSEHALEKLKPYFSARCPGPGRRAAALPGGDIAAADFDAFARWRAARLS